MHSASFCGKRYLTAVDSSNTLSFSFPACAFSTRRIVYIVISSFFFNHKSKQIMHKNDQYIKDKQIDRNDLLLKENVYLSNELEKLRKMAEESQSMFERSQLKQTEDNAELNRLKQRESELTHMNALLRQDLQLKSTENEKLQKQLLYQEKTYDNLLSGKLIQPNITQELEALKTERQLFADHIKKINEEI
uniref:Uncharacterized protein n=1 Tax=Trichobilharzia regenti TaxID=157069 RepID=A0AA85JMX5_TRIRE|nr:unnamed protein product [Trichobilharzia regenti]